MPTYYKGKISGELEEHKDVIMFKLPNTDMPIFYNDININGLTQESINSYVEYFNNIKTEHQKIEITDKNIIEICKSIIESWNPVLEFTYRDTEIIYELVKDINGNFFGKELHTGLYFPLCISDNHEMKYYAYKTNDSVKPINDRRYYYYLFCKWQPNIAVMDKCNCYLSYSPDSIANNNELEAYLNRFTKGIFRKRKEQKFKADILKLYNNNYFNSEVIPMKKTTIQKQTRSIETNIMENIEYLITKVKYIDKDKYHEYLTKYQNLLNDKNLVAGNLAWLEGELEVYLMMGKRNNEDISNYLETIKINYLEYIVYDKPLKETLTIEDIDKYEEIFLKTKDKYTAVAGRKILKDLAFIYLMQIYITLDSCHISDLKNSYIVDNMKTILVIIESLKDLGIIENNLDISLNNDITLDYLFKVIKSIKINKTNNLDIKRLIKEV